MAYIFKLSQQQDVNITSPADKDLLQYDTSSGKWLNKALSAVGLKTLTVDNTILKLNTGTIYDPAGTNSLTISHDTGAGNKHIPNVTADYISVSAGTPGSGTLNSLSSITNGGLKINSSTTGAYNTKAAYNIEVDWTQVQAKLTNPVTGTGTQWQVAYWNPTNALTGSANFTIDTSGNVTCSQNLTVSGTLYVGGSSTIVNSTTLAVQDPMISLAVGNAANTVDIGLYGTYKPAATQLYAGIWLNHADQTWTFFKDSQSEPTTTVNTVATGYVVSGIKAGLATLTGLTVTGLGGSASDNNYLVINSGTGVVNYRSLPTYDNYVSWTISDIDTGAGNDYAVTTGKKIAYIGDTVVTVTMAVGANHDKKLTFAHDTGAGNKHLPSGGSATQWLQGTATSGAGSWQSPAALTTSSAGILIGGSTSGTYDINTTKAIAVDYPTSGGNNGTSTQAARADHTHTGLLGTMTQNYVLYGQGTTTPGTSVNFQYDYTNGRFTFNGGQTWKFREVTASTDILVNDFVISGNHATVAIVLTLKTTTFSNIGQVFIVKQTGAAAVSIDPEGSQTIDDLAAGVAYTLPGRYTSVIVMITSASTAAIL